LLAVSSIAEAFRCRAVGKCASQHATEQNISLIRPELHVDTEQRQYFAPTLIGLRHIEQTANGAMARERSITTHPAKPVPNPQLQQQELEIPPRE
jgi:hypothetical protein